MAGTRVAVVGAFTAGDSAIRAMSTMIRMAKQDPAGSFADRPARSSAQRPFGRSEVAAASVHGHQGLPGRDEIPDGVGEHEVGLVFARPADETVQVDRLDHASVLARTTWVGSVSDSADSIPMADRAMACVVSSNAVDQPWRRAPRRPPAGD